MTITENNVAANSKEGVHEGADQGPIHNHIDTTLLQQDSQLQSDGNASFLRAARAGNLDKVLEYLKGSIDINTSNANGLNALHLASKEGHVSVVSELLKRGANVNAATKKGNTALHIASLAGQEDVVKVLVHNGANVNVQSQNGFTPLYMAAQENHDNVVRFLLANGANQSLATEDGFTPLAVALQQGHDKVVAVLLENDTKGRVRLPALHIAAKKDDCKAAALLLQNDHNPDVTSKSGFTPLHIAAHYGNENIAALLLEKNADVNYAAKHQITPLHVAAKWGKSNMVTLLTEKGAKIDASTRDGLTPLHCAARSGHEQVVDLLLERGAPITAKTKNGLAPLHMASQGDHVDSARILLYHKAPVDDVTVDYLTALHVAAHCGHVRVAKLLLDRKADPNARALNGFTPLHIACKKNRLKVVELLLKHGASIEATTESGLTPLHVASFMGCMNVVIYLIQHGANPDVPTVRGETPLHLAARANQTDIIRILLRNGAHVDAKAREQQTPLHIAARLGNVDIVGLLLQHGASVDATTKDMYTALHIAAKEGQEEVASVLLDHGASLTATTKKGFTPLHLAAKYGNIKVAQLLLQKDAPVDAQGKNGVTPLHVAAHYDHVNVALLLLDKGASPHAAAKNGYTPLHIAAKKNQMDIATTLLEYSAKANAESKAGFTPLHLAAQEGHTDMTTLLIEHQADVNAKAKNGLTPLHLCAQEDRVNVAAILIKNGAEIGPQTKAGYTPLHVACHFGQINMIRFLLQHGADVNATTSHGYTPLHQAAQQGHTLIINLLLEHRASPNATTNQGQTALSIAQRLGYISVVETLKVVTETIVTTTTTTVTEEKYKVVAPEMMQETFMSDSEDEGGEDFEDSALFGKPTHATHVYLPYYEGQKLQTREDTMLGDHSYRYLTADEMKSLGDDSLPIDVTKDEKGPESGMLNRESSAPISVEEEHISPLHISHHAESTFTGNFAPDNVDISRAPVHAGMEIWDEDFIIPPAPNRGMWRLSKLKWKTFLVSFMVDARGGAMRGCRHSGVRVIIPPRKAPMPMRITCRYLRKEKLVHPPPLMEGEACASRILEVGPAGAKFLGPVILEVPHFASLRGKEREITILRSDNGETWREHTLEASEEAVQEVLNESFEGEEVNALDDFNSNRITRILTTDFPQYFAIITRIRQEVHAIGPEGGMVSSTVVPQVQAIFPEGALTKKIKVGLQAQPIPPELVAKLLGNRVAVSPIVTVEPRRRKFHKPITLTIPVPQAATKGMINQYSGDAPTLRLLCSITGSTKSGGTTKAQWEDVTGSTPLTFVNDCVSFTTTVSARFWLMDCRQVNEATKFATELYREAIHVPFMAKFVVFAKRHDPTEAQLRVFCMTDDKEDKTLESQEHFTEVAKSRDVEVLEGKPQFLEFAGNLVPVTKSGEQLSLTFQAFRENRLPFHIRVKDPHQEPLGRIAFMREPRVGRGEPPQTPICNLNISLPEVSKTEGPAPVSDMIKLEKKYGFIEETGLSKPEMIHRADLRLSDIARELGKDWVILALQLDVPESDINVIKSEHPDDLNQQALVMLRQWMQKAGPKATGNNLEKALRKINRDDIVQHCIFNVELVTDDVEKAVAKVHLDQSGFDTFKEELGPSRDASLRREVSLDVSYDEQDLMKEAESAEESSSETGSVHEKLASDQTGAAEKVCKPDAPTTEEKDDSHQHHQSPVKESLDQEDKGGQQIVISVTESPVKEEKEEKKDVKQDKEEITTVVEDKAKEELSDTKMEQNGVEAQENATETEKLQEPTSAEKPVVSDASLSSESSSKEQATLEKDKADALENLLGQFDSEPAVNGSDVSNHVETNFVKEEVIVPEVRPHPTVNAEQSKPKEKILKELGEVLGDDVANHHPVGKPSSAQDLGRQEVQEAPFVKHTVSNILPLAAIADKVISEGSTKPTQGQEQVKKVTKTPPPSPIERADVQQTDITGPDGFHSMTTAKRELLPDGSIKHTITTTTKTTILHDGDEPLADLQDHFAKAVESETWQSAEMDTSQVSVSSLPEDEKSEPTTATISSTTGEPAGSSSLETDKLHFGTYTEQKAWVEEDGATGVKRVIKQTVQTTVKSTDDDSTLNMPPSEGREDLKKPDEDQQEVLKPEEKAASSPEEGARSPSPRPPPVEVTDDNELHPESVNIRPVITTPHSERRYLPDPPHKHFFEPALDVTGKVAEQTSTLEVTSQPVIVEPDDDTSEKPAIDRRHSAPDFRRLSGFETLATVEEITSAEQQTAAGEATDTEELYYPSSPKADIPTSPKTVSPHETKSQPEPELPPTFKAEQDLSPPSEHPLPTSTLAPDVSVQVGISPTEVQEVSDGSVEKMKEITYETGIPQIETKVTEIITEPAEVVGKLHDQESYEQEVFSDSEPPLSVSERDKKSSTSRSWTQSFSTQYSETSQDSDSEAPRQLTPMAFVNTAFVGADIIDATESADDVVRSGARSPYEVPRSDALLHEVSRVYEEAEPSREQCPIQETEEEIHKKIYSHIIEQSLSMPSEEEEPVTEESDDTAAKVDRCIKSHIASEELDQSIEENPPERKELQHVKEELQPPSTESEMEVKLAKQIRTEIFTHELEEDIGSGSPERKEFPPPPVADHEVSPQVTALRASLPECFDSTTQDLPIETQTLHQAKMQSEQIMWEASLVQQPSIDIVEEKVSELPRDKQIIVERDEDSEYDEVGKHPCFSDSMEVEPPTPTIPPTQEEATEIAHEIIEEIKYEVARHPTLQHIASEISDEDLVEHEDSPKDFDSEPMSFEDDSMPRSSDKRKDDDDDDDDKDGDAIFREKIKQADHFERYSDFSTAMRTTSHHFGVLENIESVDEEMLESHSLEETEMEDVQEEFIKKTCDIPSKSIPKEIHVETEKPDEVKEVPKTVAVEPEKAEKEIPKPVSVESEKEEEVSKPVAAEPEKEKEVPKPVAAEPEKEKEVPKPVAAEPEKEKEGYKPVAAEPEKEKEASKPVAAEPEKEKEVPKPVAAEPEKEKEVPKPVAAEPEKEKEVPKPVAAEPEKEKEVSKPVAAEPEKEKEVPKPVAAEPEKEKEVPKPVAAEPEKEKEVPKPVAAEPEKEKEVPKPVAAEPEKEKEVSKPVAAEPEKEKEMPKPVAAEPEKEKEIPIPIAAEPEREENITKPVTTEPKKIKTPIEDVSVKSPKSLPIQETSQLLSDDLQKTIETELLQSPDTLVKHQTKFLDDKESDTDYEKDDISKETFETLEKAEDTGLSETPDQGETTVTESATLDDISKGIRTEEAEITEPKLQKETSEESQSQTIPRDQSELSDSTLKSVSDDDDSSHGAKKLEKGRIIEKHEIIVTRSDGHVSKTERKTSKEIESWSSSGENESHYFSFETSESSRTPATSRPCSSEFDINVITGPPSEYDTCLTSQEGSGEVSTSYMTAMTSQDNSYATAHSSLSQSSRESAYSCDSESSGHLASVEISSEASETLVPSAQEMELDICRDADTPTPDDDDEKLGSMGAIMEPYDTTIPESVIRSGVEMPFMSGWSDKEKSDSQKMLVQGAEGWYTESQKSDDDTEVPSSPFEVITEQELDDYCGSPVDISSHSWKEVCQEESATEMQKTMSPDAFTQEKEVPQPSTKESVAEVDASVRSKTTDGMMMDSGPRSSLSKQDSLSQAVDDFSDGYTDQFSLSHEEEQFSESSATQSEITWQTASVETAINAASLPPGSSSAPFGHTPLSKAKSSETSQTQIDNMTHVSTTGSSISQQSSPQPLVTTTVSFSQINGPVEVDYNPEYDMSFEDLSLPAAPCTISHIPSDHGPEAGSQLTSEDSGILEMDTAVSPMAPDSSETPDISYGQAPFNHHDGQQTTTHVSVSESTSHDDELEPKTSTSSLPQSSLPDAKSGLVSFSSSIDDEIERPLSPEPPDDAAFFEDRGYLPESDQGTLHSERAEGILSANVPNVDDAQSGSPLLTGKSSTMQHYEWSESLQQEVTDDPGKSSKRESSSSFEMVEKLDIVDTSPEEDRYEIISQHTVQDGMESSVYTSIHVSTAETIGHSKPDIDSKGHELSTEPVLSYNKGTDTANYTVDGNDFPPPHSFDYCAEFDKDQDEAMEVESDKYVEEREEMSEADRGSSYAYGMQFEREHAYDDDLAPDYGELYTHQEEDEDAYVEELEGQVGHYPLPLIPSDDEKRSTPDYDTLAGRRFFSKSGDHDDLSVSSLQEFERFEAEIALDRKSSQGSVDSLCGRPVQSKSTEHDDISMNSLTEFERLERECAEAERMESMAKDTAAARLSEIDEGHESQVSEASQGTISEQGGDLDEASESEDYEKRMGEIDEIIRQAETNVEQFQLKGHADGKSALGTVPVLHTTGASLAKESLLTSDDHEADSLDEDSQQASSAGLHWSSSQADHSEQEVETKQAALAQHILVARTISGHSMDSAESQPRSSASTTTQFDTESLRDRDADLDDADLSEAARNMSHKSPLLQKCVDDLDRDSLHDECDLSVDRDSLHEDDLKEDRDSLVGDDKSADADSLQDEGLIFCRDTRKLDVERDSLQDMDLHQETSSATENKESLSEKSVSDKMASAFDDNNLEVDAKGRNGTPTLLQVGSLPKDHDSVGKGDCMVSSTDSLEPSSSTATHATYQFETDSVMSSSINSVQTSGEESTMVSSTDTVDTEPRVTYSLGEITSGDIHTFVVKDISETIDGIAHKKVQQTLDEMGNVISSKVISVSSSPHADPHASHPTHGSPSGSKEGDEEVEEIQDVDEKGNVRTIRRIKRTIQMPPRSSAGKSSAEGMEELLKKFANASGEGEEEVEEERTLDETGNVLITRTVKRHITSEPQIHTQTFTGPDAEKESKEFLKSFEKLKPSEVVDEYEATDEDGNIVRITQQVIVRPEVRTLTFSGPNAMEEMEAFMKNLSEDSPTPTAESSSQKEQTSESMVSAEQAQTCSAKKVEDKMPVSSHKTHTSTTSHTEEQLYDVSTSSDLVSTQPATATPGPHPLSEEYGGETEYSAPPLHAVYLEDDGTAEYDVREHDWRFREELSSYYREADNREFVQRFDSDGADDSEEDSIIDYLKSDGERPVQPEAWKNGEADSKVSRTVTTHVTTSIGPDGQGKTIVETRTHVGEGSGENGESLK